MPTVLRRGTLRVVIYPNYHRPAHVHVVGQSIEAVFNLHCPEGPVELREAVGLNLSKAQRLAVWIESEIAVLCARWRSIHGYH